MGYQRVSRLGRGGMGVVDLALAPDGTEVALKRLTLHGSADDIARARQRIEREVEVLSNLEHPNIVPLLAVLEEDDEVTLVMPYLTGGTLADRVARGGPLPPDQVEALAAALSGALAAAHRAEIVHRDVKPANVLYDGDEAPHLADFGVASSRDHTVGLTALGTVVGTPGFMAPEQARGDEAGQAADVFALGATLLFAATGNGPYGRGAPDLLMVRAAQGKVEPVPRSLPAGLRRSLDSMLDPRPDRRPSAAALAGGTDGTAVLSAVARQLRRRWPVWVGVAILSTVAMLAGVLVASQETADPVALTTTTDRPATTACAALPYQPCGASQPAAGTDGTHCLPDFADYDEDATNGCEATGDGLADNTPFPEGAEPIRGTIVPRDDVDTFAMAVGDGYQLLCDGQFTVTLTAPAGMTLRLEVLDGEEVLGQTTSADGVPASVRLRERECLGSDARELTAQVSPIGSDRAAAPYRLERSGSF
ncbi:MAG: serine/threonine-protein kinase [Acidimicrobiales bacterium]